jgi:hypothetical protein
LTAEEYRLLCNEKGTCCTNDDVLLTCAWTHTLLTTLHDKPNLAVAEAIKQCSNTHYTAIGMAETLRPFIGRPEQFYQFLRDTWGWIISVDADGKHILVDENKPECVCPLVRTGAASSPNLCQCSEGFAQRMFSAVLEKPVTARVRESVLRGGNHCVYEITIT